MCRIVRSLISQLFSRSEVNLKKHLTTPRAALSDVEQQLACRLRSRFRANRRAG
jgi:hypothetical protein